MLSFGFLVDRDSKATENLYLCVYDRDVFRCKALILERVIHAPESPDAYSSPVPANASV